MSEEGAPICRLCGNPVVFTREWYEVQEKMHWLCFHIMFEHFGDADKPCEDLSCPWWHIDVYRRRLERAGYDPREVLDEAIDERIGPYKRAERPRPRHRRPE